RVTAAELETAARGLRDVERNRFAELGLSKTGGAVPDSFSYYDQVLDAAFTVGAIPTRFDDVEGGELDLYFTLARGDETHQPLEMTKWFDTNYHYTVPEIAPDTKFELHPDIYVERVREAVAAGFEVRPVIVGPV